MILNRGQYGNTQVRIENCKFTANTIVNEEDSHQGSLVVSDNSALRTVVGEVYSDNSLEDVCVYPFVSPSGPEQSGYLLLPNGTSQCELQPPMSLDAADSEPFLTAANPWFVNLQDVRLLDLFFCSSLFSTDENTLWGSELRSNVPAVEAACCWMSLMCPQGQLEW